MSILTRFSNGWTIALNSFKVLRANRQLIIFPILSGVSLLLILGSFLITWFGFGDWKVQELERPDSVVHYIFLLGYYIINYFIVVFFNMALVHCTHLYFKGEEVTVKKGIAFSMSKIGIIFAWAVFAGTVGTLLKIIQENVGFLGKIITGIIGVVWGVATFFVVPVIAYENVGPIDAFKRSAKMMKEKWGESIGAGFSLGLIQFCGLMLVMLAGFGLAITIGPIVGIIAGVTGALLLFAVISAVQTIFISSVYHNITGDPVENYNQQFIDTLFVSKGK